MKKFTRRSSCRRSWWLKQATRFRKTLSSIPGGAVLCFFFVFVFSSDRAVSSSIFEGANREENLIVSTCRHHRNQVLALFASPTDLP